HVQESLRFLMTREIAHFQMFHAALDTIQPNFPPGVLQGDPRFTHTYFNMSNGTEVRGPWNQGQGPWPQGEQWAYVEDPLQHSVTTRGLIDQPIVGSSKTQAEVKKLDKALSKLRSTEVASAAPKGENQWSSYPQDTPLSPMDVDETEESEAAHAR
ncbi:MAG: Mn-containing catalase, partial [Armatimonadetes bacterium]|nr:Mn-containing catalase [Armatimonadota bacterium]